MCVNIDLSVSNVQLAMTLDRKNKYYDNKTKIINTMVRFVKLRVWQCP